jgi:hypothetical protein
MSHTVPNQHPPSSFAPTTSTSARCSRSRSRSSSRCRSRSWSSPPPATKAAPTPAPQTVSDHTAHHRSPASRLQARHGNSSTTRGAPQGASPTTQGRTGAQHRCPKRVGRARVALGSTNRLRGASISTVLETVTIGGTHCSTPTDASARSDPIKCPFGRSSPLMSCGSTRRSPPRASNSRRWSAACSILANADRRFGRAAATRRHIDRLLHP